MHSSKLRGADFHIREQGRAIPHEQFFVDWSEWDRLGVFAPEGWEGTGAITLVLAAVTAFYDRLRAHGEPFYAYPDYFTYQRREAPADYGMCDIWPRHKQVPVPGQANETAAAMTDRGVTLLLLPDRPAGTVALERVQEAALRRNIRRYFLYGADGDVDKPTLEVEGPVDPLGTWALTVFQSLASGEFPEEARSEWESRVKEGGRFRQCFREVSAEEAWRRLV